jgi:hypothetical protein
MTFRQWALLAWFRPPLGDGKYQQLNPDLIFATLEKLSHRICERFPHSHLSEVSRELLKVGRNSEEILAHLRRPIWPLRIMIFGGILTLVVVVTLAFSSLWKYFSTHVESWTDVLQGFEAAINEIIFLAIAIFFLGGLEMRYKRWMALRLLHQLRSIAHVVDMHQLTKDPAIILAGTRLQPTESSPARQMTAYELTRYLEYCSELLAINSKLAALHAQYIDDPVVLSSVNDVESLSQGLSNKIWQKIMILDLAAPGWETQEKGKKG